MECEIPQQQSPPEEIVQALKRYSRVAVVGISDKTERPSYQVAQYLKQAGYRILPVNPQLKTVLGETCYASLADLPEVAEIVDIFRRAEAVPQIVDQAIAQGAKMIWMQEGVVHNAAAAKALKAGLQVVMNKCILKEHRKLD